ncbi:hypothetical protein AAVH_18717 [Aphelenchoides avenae]|nr:hypothetical protein AAVH_18717 [Aphelenchus avenae]
MSRNRPSVPPQAARGELAPHVKESEEVARILAAAKKASGSLEIREFLFYEPDLSYELMAHPTLTSFANFTRERTQQPPTQFLARIEKILSQPPSARALAAVRGEIVDELEDVVPPHRKQQRTVVDRTPAITRHFRSVILSDDDFIDPVAEASQERERVLNSLIEALNAL